jgi:hypothetical protein
MNINILIIAVFVIILFMLYITIQKRNNNYEHFDLGTITDTIKTIASPENLKSVIPLYSNLDFTAQAVKNIELPTIETAFLPNIDLNQIKNNIIPDVVKQTVNYISQEEYPTQTIASEEYNKVILTQEQIDDLNDKLSNFGEFGKTLAETLDQTSNILTQSIPEENISYPDEEDVVSYSEEECSKIIDNDFNVIANQQRELKTCGNSSIAQQKYNCYGQMMYNSQNINDIEFPICGQTENIKVELNDDTDIDYLEYYRKHQMFVKSYLEDPILRGYNVDGYDNASPLFTTGKIPLDKKFKFPKPSGYIFNDSPAYKM